MQSDPNAPSSDLERARAITKRLRRPGAPRGHAAGRTPDRRRRRRGGRVRSGLRGRDRSRHPGGGQPRLALLERPALAVPGAGSSGGRHRRVRRRRAGPRHRAGRRSGLRGGRGHGFAARDRSRAGIAHGVVRGPSARLDPDRVRSAVADRLRDRGRQWHARRTRHRRQRAARRALSRARLEPGDRAAHLGWSTSLACGSLRAPAAPPLAAS